jgi:hypothetical protein
VSRYHVPFFIGLDVMTRCPQVGRKTSVCHHARHRRCITGPMRRTWQRTILSCPSMSDEDTPQYYAFSGSRKDYIKTLLDWQALTVRNPSFISSDQLIGYRLSGRESSRTRDLSQLFRLCAGLTIVEYGGSLLLLLVTGCRIAYRCLWRIKLIAVYYLITDTD